jgi:hypothetical protein
VEPRKEEEEEEEEFILKRFVLILRTILSV